MNKIRYFLLIILLFSPYVLSLNELTDIAYRGYVEQSQEGGSSDENVDFSRIEVRLMTEDSRVLEKTFCSENGFFLLPINERKKYIIKVFSQDNLSFEPEFRVLDLLEKSDGEIKLLIDKSDSFKFTGFAVKGQVLSQNSKDLLGPKGILLGLYDSKEQFLQTTSTQDSGHFSFEKLPSGNYTIKPIEVNIEVLGYSLSKTEKLLKCEVSWGKPFTCQGRIIIHGYTYTGYIMNEETPLKNFYVFLYEKSFVEPPHPYPCDKPVMVDHPFAAKGSHYLCYEVSDQKGGFQFRDLVYGDYILSIKAIEDDKKVEIERNEVLIDIRHAPINKTLQFQVNRFSIQGKVHDTQGKGIANVTISLDGEEKTKTNEQGIYYLEKIKSGTYTLEGLHDHLFFEPIHELKLSIGLKQVPNLVLTYLHVCGKVLLNFENLFQEAQDSHKFKITIYLEDLKGEKRTTFPDTSGHFCFEAKPGNYSIYPVIDKSLSDISFFPSKHIFEITNNPRLDLDFHRPKVSIYGHVDFLPELSKNLREKTKVKIACTGSQKTLSHEISPSGDFFINNVLSGNYEISIENEDLCWEKSAIPLEISQNSNITGLKFKQTGFSMRYEVQNSIEAEVVDPKGVHSIWTFNPESSFKCVTEPGIYHITPNDCSSYKETVFIYKTDQSQKVSLIPLKHLISGLLKFNISKTITKELLDKLPSALNQLNYLNIESLPFDGSSILETVNVPFIYQENPKDNTILTFSFRHYVKPYTVNRIIPRTNTSIQLDPTLQSLLENLLFYPSKREIKISQTCQIRDADFLIKAGLIIIGKILPENIEDVNITILQDGKEIDTVPLINGSFKAGPFSDASEYKVEAYKYNYRFAQTESLLIENILNFKLLAQRLSIIKVFVQDSTGKPISGVSVFISSTAKNEKLNLNNVTDDKGLFISNNLVKGEYMVKCSLKEYSFDPNQKTVKILEGDNTEIIVLGKQITFSIYGKVLRLNQEGLHKQIVEIYEDNHLKEKAQTNSQGVFRIRALEPFKNYVLSLNNQENLHYYKPKTIEVSMKDHDINDIEFLVFEKRTKYSIMGTIEFDEKFLKEEIDDIQGFEVEIYEFKDQSTPLNEVRRILVNRYFEFEELNMKEYVVKLSYKRTKNSNPQEISKIYNLTDLHNIDFQMSKKFVIHKIVQENKKGQTPTFSFLAPVFLFIILIALLNLDKTKEILGNIIGIIKKN